MNALEFDFLLLLLVVEHLLVLLDALPLCLLLLAELVQLLAVLQDQLLLLLELSALLDKIELVLLEELVLDLVGKGLTTVTTTTTFNCKRRLPWRTNCVRKLWNKSSARITSQRVQMRSSGPTRTR